jgi:ribosomal protein S18 acetylase RimI-like enzyme
MATISYRKVINRDIAFLAKIHSNDPATEKHRNGHILGYLDYTHNPQQALRLRVIYVATDNDEIVGFAAGHLTTRYDCEGELQWIHVIEKYRKLGIASELVQVLAKWFIEQKSYKICVDPGNETARLFYKRNAAVDLNDHWMFWKDIRSIIV